MKKNIKRIINLIVLIAIAIVMYIFLRNIPSMLVASDNTKINKIEEELKAAGGGAVNTNFQGYDPAKAVFTTESLGFREKGYLDFKHGNNYLYCAFRGGVIHQQGFTYDRLVSESTNLLSTKSDYHKSESSAASQLASFVKQKAEGIPGKQRVVRKGNDVYLYATFLHYFEMDGEYAPRKATPKEAYILTYQGVYKKDYDEFNAIRQEAIWKTPSLRVKDIGKEGHDKHNEAAAESVIEQAEKFEDFIKAIEKNTKVEKGTTKLDKDNKKTSDNEKVYTEIIKNNNTKGGIIKENSTDFDKLQVSHQENTTEYVVGPFSIDYVDIGDQTNGGKGVVFGGISKMYFVDENNNKIDVGNIQFSVHTDSDGTVKNNTFKDLSFFEPIEQAWIQGQNFLCSGESGTEYKKEDYKQSYPKSGQKFYLRFSTTSTNRERIEKLQVDFKWMEAKASIKWYEGVTYAAHFEGENIGYETKHDDHDYKRAFYKSVTIETVKGAFSRSEDGSFSVQTSDTQPTEEIFYDEQIETSNEDVLGYSTGRGIHTERMRIKVPKGTQEENLQMELAGFVWEDKTTDNKESSEGVTGIMQNEDSFMEGIEVILFYANADGTKGAMVEPHEIKDGKDVRPNLVNPYVTGKNGHYEFKDLDANKNYIIEYVYDGQKYQATKYTASNLKDVLYATENYKDGSLQEIFTNTLENITGKNEDLYAIDYNPSNLSKGSTTLLKDKSNAVNSGAIEITNGEDTRTKFNNRFATINSTPGNYTVSRIPGEDYGKADSSILGYSSGDKNTIWLIDESKDSEKTKYGIKELYNEVKRVAINKDSYKEAYKEVLNNWQSYGDSKKEVQSKLQFIEDTRITAENTSSANAQYARRFPIFDDFAEVFEGDKDYKEGPRSVVGDLAAYYKTIGGSTNAGGKEYYALYPSHLNIDFGITRRAEFDLALKKDVEQVTVEINGKSHVYRYDEQSPTTSESGKITDAYYQAITEDKDLWDITARINDSQYYAKNYTRYLYADDYLYKATMYSSGSESLTDEQKYQEVLDNYNKKQEDELEVYVTYKLTIRNQSQNILGEVLEVADYYDSEYTYMPDRSYIQIKRGNNKGVYDVGMSENSSYGNRTQLSYNSDKQRYDYSKLYVNGLNNIKLSSGQTAYVYLTFKVNKDNGYVILDEESKTGTEIDKGKENIAEITAYSTYYPDTGLEVPNRSVSSNTVAGLIDIDSVAGNAGISKKMAVENQKTTGTITGNIAKNKDNTAICDDFEDDMDKSPNMQIKLYRDSNTKNALSREITGSVWEDIRTVYNKENQKTATGNGIKDVNDIPVNGVTVQLVEIIEKDGQSTEFIWREFGLSDTEGDHSKDQNEPVNYQARNELTKDGGSGMVNSEKPIITQDDIVTIDNLALTKGQGEYGFKSFIPGNYIVRFIYGDTIKTVVPNSASLIKDAGSNYNNLLGENEKSYNGQDYKSTIYQSHIENTETTTVNQNYEGVYNELKGRNGNGDYWVEQNGYMAYQWRTLDTSETNYRYVNKYLNDYGEWVYVYFDNNQNRYVAICRYFDDSDGSWHYKEVNSNVENNNYSVYREKLLETISTFRNKDKDLLNVNQNETVTIDGKNSDDIYSQVGYLYDITATNNYPWHASDAKDIESRRNAVNKFSNNDGLGSVENRLSEILASHSQMPIGNETLTNELTELINKTYMEAETGLIVIECEIDDTVSASGNTTPGIYKIENLDLGLEERPKAQLAINKEVTNVRLTLADGSTLYDASDKTVTNVLWNDHQRYFDNYYEKYFDINSCKFRGENPMEYIRATHSAPDAQYGLIQMSMDEELMHGATLKISYKITVTNIGEVDYYNNGYIDRDTTVGARTNTFDRAFYYTGIKSTSAEPVKTKADKLIDYVSNNLQFYAKDNSDWEIIKDTDILREGTDVLHGDLVSESISREVNGNDSIISEYNTIIQTKDNAGVIKELLPFALTENKELSSASSDLVLTQLITAENGQDDLQYRNVVEIVQTTNDLGRRNAYSIVGNQDPTVKLSADGTRIEVKEIDADCAQLVKILPPYGNSGQPQIIAAIVLASSVILIVGIVFIRKKILK